jgi:hypothetical protein
MSQGAKGLGEGARRRKENMADVGPKGGAKEEGGTTEGSAPPKVRGRLSPRLFVDGLGRAQGHALLPAKANKGGQKSLPSLDKMGPKGGSRGPAVTTPRTQYRVKKTDRERAELYKTVIQQLKVRHRPTACQCLDQKSC